MVLHSDQIGNIIGRRYRLDSLLGAGGMGVVFAAYDLLTRQVVALKQVNLHDLDHQTSSPTLNSGRMRLSLAHEFRILASLRHPNIISVLDYGFDTSGNPYFTMELLSNPRTIVEASRGRPLREQIALLVQLFQALAYLHRRSLLHRDLKPANILVTQENVLKVLDFGLSHQQNQTQLDNDSAVGTLAYMAPEVLAGDPATITSDLYGAGIVAFEVLAGEHPFLRDNQKPNIVQIIQDVYSKSPDFSLLNVDDSLVNIIGRLVSKSPDTRYESAYEIIEAINTTLSDPIPVENLATRNSFLQGAEFIGRQNELRQIQAAFEQSCSGQGSAWLIAGESGVGKSRLLDEIRALTLVEGSILISGQGIREGSSPYAIWRDLLRWLVMTTPVSELEAGVLKPLIPDIDDLLGYPVPDAPELMPQAVQARVFNVIEEVFRRYLSDSTLPLTLILEDVHWASGESLRVMDRLSRVAGQLPVLLVASYRDDEAPYLLARQPACTPIKLLPLTEDEIFQLSASMLGVVGENSQVVDLLRRETEGNAFFMTEVARALAEEAGSLEDVAKHTIPQQLFAGGIRTVVQRRLGRAPDNARELIKLAAVNGLQLDLILLREAGADMIAQSGMSMDDWLVICSDAGILAVQDNSWRFVHDRLRQGALEALSRDELKHLHGRIAHAIEQIHPDSPEHYSALAHHYHQAEEPQQEMHYAALAGEQALRNGAYQIAVGSLQRALQLANVGSMQRLRRALLEQRLSAAHMALGDMAQGMEHIRAALAHYGYPLPEGRFRLMLQVVSQGLRQFGHRMLPILFVGRAKKQAALLTEAALAHEQLGEVGYYTNNTLLGLYSVLRTLNLAERTVASSQLGRAYGAASYIALLLNRGVSEMYNRKARVTAKRVGDPFGIARAYHLTCLRHIGLGRWNIAQTSLEEVIQLYENLGEQRHWGMALHSLGEVYYLTGDFARSLEAKQRIFHAAQRYGDSQAQGFGKRGEAMNFLVQNRVDEAAQSALDAAGFFRAGSDRIGEIDSWALLALANARRHDNHAAFDQAKRALQLSGGIAPSSYNLLIGYSAIAETFLLLQERDPTSEELLDYARQACTALRRFSKRFMIGWPRTYLYLGMLEAQSGKVQHAQKSWEKGLQAARRLHMPYDEALLKRAIGIHQPLRRHYLEEANAMFHELGAAFDLAQS